MYEAGAPSIAKHLASCNTRTRSQALAHLTTFFSSHPSISDSNMLKIRKGLFYSLWHADKLPVQLRLIQRLSSLLLSLHPSPICFQYLHCFITTICHEWAGIDSLRLDKFYLLIHCFLRHLFLLLKSNSWDLELLNRFMDVLVEMTLLPTDSYLEQGVNYHISEAFLEELKEFIPLTTDVLDALLKPFFSVLEKSTDKVLVSKLRKSMIDCLLENGKKKISDLGKGGTCVDSNDEDAKKFAIISLGSLPEVNVGLDVVGDSRERLNSVVVCAEKSGLWVVWQYHCTSNKTDAGHGINIYTQTTRQSTDSIKCIISANSIHLITPKNISPNRALGLSIDSLVVVANIEV